MTPNLERTKLNIFTTPCGDINLSFVQWVDPIRKTDNGYAFDVHLMGEICPLFFGGDDNTDAVDMRNGILSELGKLT